MRTRIAVVGIIRVALMLVAAGAGGACDDSPTPISPSALTTAPVSASGPTTPASAAITCSSRLSRPGDTCQLTMTVTFSDGSTRDVTADARWGYGGAVTVSSSGFVTAGSYGLGEIIHNAYRELGPNPMQVRVVPEGSFIVTGRVTESGGFKLGDARVSGSSASGAATTTSGDDGSYVLAPVSGEAVLRVVKEGYVVQERKVNVQRDEVADFDLPRSTSPVASIDGVYNLTFTAAPSCALPADFVRRTYRARITEKADGLLAELDGPGFPGDFYQYGFTGKRDGSTVRFDLYGDPCSLDPLCWDHEYLFREYPDGLCLISQTCGPQRYVGYSGTATGTIGESTFSLVFSGVVRLWGAQNAACSGDHRLEFTR